MGLIQRIKGFFGGPFNGAQEGSYRGPFYGLGELGNSFLLGKSDDGWQRHLNVNGAAELVPSVNAAGTAYARAGSICRVGHYQLLPNGEHQLQTESTVANLLRSPNEYETFPQYIFNTIAEMQFKGESLSLIVRDDRLNPVALHRIQHGNWQPYIDPESRALFYGISSSGNPLAPGELDYLVPARDVIHFRQYTPRHPLHGETPIKAAALAIGINVALSESQVAFFNQMRRPSGIISSDQVLNKEQVLQLREAFDEQSAGMKSGGIPILGGGLKFQALSITSEDAQLIEAQRMTIEDIARVFGVPLPILGDLSHATLNNAETLINHWLSLGLGSLLENLERSLEKGLRLTAREAIEFDTGPLLRSDFQARIDGLTRAIQGGLMTVNEARNREGLASTEFGDEPFVQAQMVPVSVAAQQNSEPAAPVAPVEPETVERELSVDADITKALVSEMLTRKRDAMA